MSGQRREVWVVFFVLWFLLFYFFRKDPFFRDFGRLGIGLHLVSVVVRDSKRTNPGELHHKQQSNWFSAFFSTMTHVRGYRQSAALGLCWCISGINSQSAATLPGLATIRMEQAFSLVLCSLATFPSQLRLLAHIHSSFLCRTPRAAPPACIDTDINASTRGAAVTQLSRRCSSLFNWYVHYSALLFFIDRPFDPTQQVAGVAVVWAGQRQPKQGTAGKNRHSMVPTTTGLFVYFSRVRTGRPRPGISSDRVVMLWRGKAERGDQENVRRGGLISGASDTTMASLVMRLNIVCNRRSNVT